MCGGSPRSRPNISSRAYATHCTTIPGTADSGCPRQRMPTRPAVSLISGASGAAKNIASPHAGGCDTNLLTRDVLLEKTPARQGRPLARTIDNQVRRLRRKVEVEPSRPRLILTVRGRGYTAWTSTWSARRVAAASCPVSPGMPPGQARFRDPGHNPAQSAAPCRGRLLIRSRQPWIVAASVPGLQKAPP